MEKQYVQKEKWQKNPEDCELLAKTVSEVLQLIDKSKNEYY